MNIECRTTIKAATVAIALLHPNQPSAKNRPFTIIGSGFCIHPEGLIVTCEHVHKAFFDQKMYESVLRETDPNVRHEVQGLIPHAIFYGGLKGGNLIAVPVPVQNAVTKMDFDLAILKLHRHAYFKHGFPVVQLARYEDIRETVEVGTCGFPLGQSLEDQIGTVTSSFTRGMISSIIPAEGVPRDYCRGFQLDLTATNGNSGGPVFLEDTGSVFGVLSRGVTHPQTGQLVQGFTKAEPVYPLLANDLVNRILKMNG